METKRNLIVNADDFGLTPGVSAGILYAHQHGIVSSTTVMVNTEFANEALQAAECFPALGIGLHFVLDAGRPLSSCPGSLIDENGDFLKGEALIASAEKQDVKEELQAQLWFLFDQGIEVTHIDSHHHMHLHIPCALEAVTEVAKEYRLPIRTFSEMQNKEFISTTDYLRYDFYGEDHITAEYLLQLFSELEPGVTEVMCHPAFIDTWLWNKSSYRFTRAKELALLTDSRISDWLIQHEVGLIHYGGL
ncbi:ChbG/HpnK family deacetylase [Sediminibacillus dalangtanensis]|uniref:ChbG/HpnK family deacetylase n=1 Tax=Sediminibacillus dalangtanensis TaxID=2729421 RepID=A0ABX7W0K3_9BACI|nr:carbohydrate deacetylase [Sediminibacillus dalangtanensis]QTN00707.1 ChbG/HpnK family deacetylase [Sediminibacillus dalangtanensis]